MGQFPPTVLLSHLSAFSEAVPLARLVEAEIVSLYSGILINTGVGNPTAPLTAALGREASFIRPVGARSFGRLYKGIRIYPFHLRLLPPLLIRPCALELQRPSPHFPPQPSPIMSGAGGRWMASSVTERQIKKLRKAGYLSDDIAHRFPDAGQLIPTPRPHERVVFFPISSVDWVFLFTRSSGGSCSTMAWTSTICPELHSQFLGVYRRV